MKKLITIILLCFSLVARAEIIVDTIQADQLIEQIDSELLNSIMWQKMREQAEDIFRRNDSIHQWRLRNDMTTISPFHIGYRDSILMAVERTEQQFYLQKIGLYTMPQIWNKHYIFSSVDNNKLMVSEPVDSRMKLKKTGSMTMLIDSYDFDDENVEMELSTLETERSWAPDIEKEKKIKPLKPIYQHHWYSEVTLQLQVTQNYVSKNWHTGGSSNFAVLGIVIGKINYNDFKRITWENTIEWRAGAGTNSADTIRKISTTEDLFRAYSKFNYKAVSKIYYSVSGEFLTQFFDTYKEANSTILVSSLFTPVRFNLNAGMDFKPVKGLSIAVSPLSFKYVYVRDTTRIEQTKFSVESGRKSLAELGSSVRIEYSYKPVKEFSLDSKLYFYTNYKKVEADLEITANVIFNQYLSARINLHPRYDNTVILSGDEKAKIQFKEFLSVGFTHRFR